MRLALGLGLLSLVLSFSACEGGCGEAPKTTQASDGSGQTVSGTTGGGGGGDAAIPLGGQRKKKAEEDNPLAPPKQETAPIRAAADVEKSRAQGATGVEGAAGAAPTSDPARLAAIMDVSAADFEQKVLKSKQPVLMLYLTSSCRPCSSVEFELGKLSKEYAGKVAFARMDLNKPGCYELLPTGLRRLPLPAMAFYQDGAPLNIRQNIPVPHDSSSLLTNWLRRVIDGRDVRLN